jgi:hypothetical protein
MSKNGRMLVRQKNLLVYFDSDFLIHLFPPDKESGVRNGAGIIQKIAVSITDGVNGTLY